MRREIIGLLFAATLAACIGSAHAQPPEPVRTLGIVGHPQAFAAGYLEPLRQALREQGWIEGRNIRLEIRPANEYEHAFAAITDLVRLPVDVLFLPGAGLAKAAGDATDTIPIVFSAGADPVSSGVVRSYSRPGRNLTGIVGSMAEVSAKQLELLLHAVPHARRVALLLPRITAGAPVLMHAEQTARELGLQLHVVLARDGSELTRGLAEITRTPVDALVVPLGGALRDEVQRIAEFAMAHRLPMITTEGSLDAASLLRYGQSHPDAMRRVAHHIDRILRGAKPADLPVERVSRFHLVVNLKVARTIGVVVPDTLLRIADEVIE